ncbi:MAG: hypothetical protein LRY43_03285 [Gammaproteobacteria bacterium]|nr:hypothetical protein [Gammaproteobacteria bacterium]
MKDDDDKRKAEGRAKRLAEDEAHKKALAEKMRQDSLQRDKTVSTPSAVDPSNKKRKKIIEEDTIADDRPAKKREVKKGEPAKITKHLHLQADKISLHVDDDDDDDISASPALPHVESPSKKDKTRWIICCWCYRPEYPWF